MVLFGLVPTNTIARASGLFVKTRRTLSTVTRLIGYRYEDGHEMIPGFEGGMESNGFSSGIVATTAAHLNTAEALSIAQAHARKDAVAGLKREVEKARRRLQHKGN